MIKLGDKVILNLDAKDAERLNNYGNKAIAFVTSIHTQPTYEKEGKVVKTAIEDYCINLRVLYDGEDVGWVTSATHASKMPNGGGWQTFDDTTDYKTVADNAAAKEEAAKPKEPEATVEADEPQLDADAGKAPDADAGQDSAKDSGAGGGGEDQQAESETTEENK